MKVSAVFNRTRISKLITALLIGGLFPTFLPTPAGAAPACVLNTDYTKDTSSVSGYTILKFTKTGSCSFRNTEAITSFDYLIVGGGGGGGAHVGGGGGGGGVRQGTTSISGLGAIPITVGVGGTGAWVSQSAWQTYGTNGGNSSLNSLIAYGGGVGGIWNTVAPGNGANVVGSVGGSGQVYNTYVGTAGQGNLGGAGNNVQPHAAGGGGGAGQVGGNGTQTANGNGTGGKGGDGVAVGITGTSTYFGGGGGGGVHGNNNAGTYTGGAGGLGGGGAGSSHEGSYTVTPRQPANYGTSGTANTGGGGGGAGGGLNWVENKAGNGGSGIVVIKYANANVALGEIDSAISTGSTKFFYAPVASEILPGTLSTLSMEAWIKPSSTCDGNYYCSILAVNQSFLLDIYQGKIVYFTGSGTAWCNSGAATTVSNAPITSGRWHHISMIRNSSNVKIYLNGNLVSNLDNGCSLTASASVQFGVGYREGNDQYFYGNIDDVRIWSTDRSSNVIEDMHSNATSTNGLLAYWNFNEGAGEASYNQSTSAKSETDLIAYGTAKASIWDSNAVSEATTVGPYSVRTFYKTYLNASGGWRPPRNLNATILLVGGGGGGGKGASSSSGPSGAGGGGGVTYLPAAAITNSIVPVKVGQGGIGAVVIANDASSRNGQSSEINYGSLATALGGGAGASFGSGFSPSGSGAGDNSVATGGGSSGFAYSGGDCGGFGGVAGSVSSGYNGGRGVWGWGGAGGGARGAATNGNCQNQQGVPGAGFVDPLTSIEYGRGGYSRYSTASSATRFNVANSGFGGSVAYNDGQASGNGYNGSAGIIIVRWITASVPTYTKPVNANLNIGMTETFTVNVATDSATAQLTRTFRWESSTAGAAGPWTLLKQGTGASNAFFSWVPPDTSTSGSNFLYRLTVTDSDTAGLFITDSSTAYAVINGALGVSGATSVGKSINSSRDETFTVTNGTPTYRYSLSPTISGITLDTRTVGYPVLRIAETVTVGTYLETLTVTDSVSAAVNYPLRITISAPPSLTAGGEIVKDGQVLNLDASNRWSIQAIDGAATAGLVWKDMSGGQKNASTSNAVAVNGATCTAPTFSSDYGGYFTFNGTTNCYYTPYLGSQFTAANTLEAWIKPSSNTHPNSTAILGQMYNTAGEQISLVMGDMDRNNGKIYIGFWSGNGWRYPDFAITPVANTWMHIAGTYDGTTLRTYLNGVLQGTATYSSYGTTNTKGYFIGKRWDTNSYFYPGAIAEVRAYAAALSQSQVTQNYNATRARFTADNLNQTKPSQKHNTTTIETFTVTSGGDTKTVTFAVGNITGIEWTTSDTATVKLTVKPDLVVGTYYDTVTVTDNFSTSTILPVKITISKGDQAKLSFGQYNAFPGVSSYPINVYGGSGGGTVTRSLVDSGTAGCVLTSSMFLTAARVGACTVRAVKATDTNWLAETATATIYWIQWSDAYATRVPSTPTEIVLNHETAITKYNYETLTVTTYQNSSGVTITSIATGATLRIIGDGFDPAAAYTEVVFFNNSEALDLTSGLQVISSGGSNYLQLTVPSGAESGIITVNSPKGTARGPSLTILSP